MTVDIRPQIIRGVVNGLMAMAFGACVMAEPASTNTDPVKVRVQNMIQVYEIAIHTYKNPDKVTHVTDSSIGSPPNMYVLNRRLFVDCDGWPENAVEVGTTVPDIHAEYIEQARVEDFCGPGVIN